MFALFFILILLSACLSALLVVGGFIAFTVHRRRAWIDFAEEHGLTCAPGIPIIGAPRLKGIYKGARIRVYAKYIFLNRTRSTKTTFQLAETHYEADLRHITPKGLWYESGGVLKGHLRKHIKTGIAAVDEKIIAGGAEPQVVQDFLTRPDVQHSLLRLANENKIIRSYKGMLRFGHPFVASSAGTLERNLDSLALAATTLGGEFSAGESEPQAANHSIA